MFKPPIRIGLLREGKVPTDLRVPLNPDQCKQLMAGYAGVEVVVQSSPDRAYSDMEYKALGIEVVDSLESCDLLFGVKEVPIEQLIPDKTYFFFSHTYKHQPYNRNLLRAIIEKNITLIDYEAMRRKDGSRIIGFGHYAGIVGTYSGLRGYGILSGRYSIPPAHECRDLAEMKTHLPDIDLPGNFRIAITGHGRVANGALDILSALDLQKVPVKAYLEEPFNEPVYVQLGSLDYNVRKDGGIATRNDFYQNPEDYRSDFMRYAQKTDIYIACHYWAEGAPPIFTREQAQSDDFNIKLVSDISCDIDGPVASTLRAATIDQPYYGYDAVTGTEVPFGTEGSIGVQAVDNLPCELPRDASTGFGEQLLEGVFPLLFGGDPEGVIEGATGTRNGGLTPQYAYLQSWLDDKNVQDMPESVGR